MVRPPPTRGPEQRRASGGHEHGAVAEHNGGGVVFQHRLSIGLQECGRDPLERGAEMGCATNHHGQLWLGSHGIFCFRTRRTHAMPLKVVASYPRVGWVRVTRNHEDVNGAIGTQNGLHVVADGSVDRAIDSTAPQNGAVVRVRTER